MSMKIMCTCGQTLTTTKHKGPREDIPVMLQCSTCMIAGYEVGYADGAITATHKTTLAEIVLAAGRDTI